MTAKILHCEVRDALAEQFKNLLDKYTSSLAQLTAIHGIAEAEDRVKAEYHACILAREEFKYHIEKHGCGDPASRRTDDFT